MRQLIHRMALTMALTSLFTSVPAQQRDVSPESVQAPPATVSQAPGHSWLDVPTQTLSAGGVDFAYRELGKQHGGTPVVLLVHLAAVLDNWDPSLTVLRQSRHYPHFFKQEVSLDEGTSRVRAIHDSFE